MHPGVDDGEHGAVDAGVGGTRVLPLHHRDVGHDQRRIVVGDLVPARRWVVGVAPVWQPAARRRTARRRVVYASRPIMRSTTYPRAMVLLGRELRSASERGLEL
jgi:hypothetical protein